MKNVKKNLMDSYIICYDLKIIVEDISNSMEDLNLKTQVIISGVEDIINLNFKEG